MNDPIANEAGIRDWLRRKRAMNTPLCLLGALALVFSGLLVLLLTAYVCFFSFLYGWMGIASAWEIVSGHAQTRWPAKAIGWFTAGFLILSFVGAARSKWWERGDIPKGVWPALRRGEPASPVASLVASAKFCTDLLYTGPRLFGAAWRTFQKAIRLWQLDVEHCARWLWMLLASHQALPCEELVRQLSSLCERSRLEQQLKDIEGVIFLENSVTLSSDLRTELSQHLHASS